MRFLDKFFLNCLTILESLNGCLQNFLTPLVREYTSSAQMRALGCSLLCVQLAHLARRCAAAAKNPPFALKVVPSQEF